MGDLESGGKGKENHVTLAFASSKVSLQQEAPSCNKPAYVSANVSLRQQQEDHSCYICTKTFSQRSSLTKHMKTHKVGEGHVCKKCNKRFAASRDLRKHVDIVHLNKAEEYKKECPICHVRVQQLKTHIRFIHRNEGKTSEYSGICPHCEKTFSNDYKVKRHIETVHEGIKHWQCSVCPKRFYEKKDLGRHIRGVHMGEKVDLWRGKTKANLKEEAVIVTRSVLPTVELGGPGVPQTTLPVNVLAEEGDDLLEAKVDDPGEEVVEPDEDVPMATPHGFPLQDEILDVSSLRFQVCDRRVDEDGDIVVEIEEKEAEVDVEKNDEKESLTDDQKDGQMVTLKWASSGSPSKSGSRETGLSASGAHLGEEEELGEDFVLPEVVGDLPEWLLQGGGELDILRVQDEGGAQRTRARHVSEDRTKTAFKCGACSKMFLTLDFLKSHIEKIHITYKLPEELSQLNETSGEGSMKTVFKVHNDEHGKKFVVSDSPESPVKEDVRGGLKVEGEERLHCDMEGCMKTFSGKGRKLQYKRHVERIHLSIRNKHCPQCNLSFYEKRDLSRHIEAIHLRIRTICPIEGCAKPVVRLDQHIKMVHSERTEKTEKGSKCEECGASFSRVYDLTRHRENVHRGLKSFHCDKCERRFTDKRDLKRHHDAVHLNIRQGKVYSCNFCDKNFKFKKLLDSHRQTEHNGGSSGSKSQSKKSSRTNLEDEDMGSLVMVGEDQEEVTLGEELSTVEIEGQLFLVQQNSQGLALLPVVQSVIGEKT